jgi:sterol desaturase/sphingolipid hydroxylase (fatty acid hydroxylase superfamily)
MAAITLSESSIADNIARMKLGEFNPYREFNEWLNGLFFNSLNLSFLPSLVYDKLGPDTGYYFTSYIRDLIAGTAVYWVTAGLWHITIYHIYVNELFLKKGKRLPTWDTIFDQMKLAQSSLFLYAGLPIVSEFLIENNLTQTYFYIHQIGGYGNYFFFLFVYYFFVEIGIYWMHRTLHTNKFLYKYIHGLHHKYNKESTLTPWASVAFNPLDGILQVNHILQIYFFIYIEIFLFLYLKKSLVQSICNMSFLRSCSLLYSRRLCVYDRCMGDLHPRRCGILIITSFLFYYILP